MTPEQYQELKRKVDELERRRSVSGMAKWFVPGSTMTTPTGTVHPAGIESYPKHKLFFDSGSKYRERVFMSGNRIGKTAAAGYEVACHLTGKYPAWWVGRKFTHPVEFMVAGKDKTTTRDTIQRTLLGPVGSLGTGMLPAADIIRTWSMQGVPNGVEMVTVRHVSGGTSILYIKSYDRGVESFMGTAMHGVWMDEESDEDVYAECLVRTMTTNGLIIATFTPKKGLSRLVVTLASGAVFLDCERFMELEQGVDEAEVSRAVVMAGWDDVPHLDEEAKKEILRGTPAMLRDSVSKGLPAFGEGNVYPVARSSIECDPFVIPSHYKRWYGMDVGWNCTAAVFFAQDPDSKQVWITDVYKGERTEPLIHATAIKIKAQDWMLGAIDPGARQRTQQDGSQLLQIYRTHGLNVIPANNSVESGVGAVWELLSTGRLKVFKSCTALFSEFMTYIYEHGKIKKTNDHIMDAMRYGVFTMEKVARTPPENKSIGVSHSGRRFDF